MFAAVMVSGCKSNKQSPGGETGEPGTARAAEPPRGRAAPVARPAAPKLGNPTVVFNVTSGKKDLHAVTMALQLAGHSMAVKRRVLLFFNVRMSVRI